jgi:serine/threonine-protein kinase HipA
MMSSVASYKILLCLDHEKARKEATMPNKILVYAHWESFAEPTFVGTLRSTPIRNKEHFSFSYDHEWLNMGHAQKIDPRLELYTGEQHSGDNRNFKAFLDSTPDRWGRLLMDRRELVLAKRENRQREKLYESDYLLGVHDLYRMGGLRFKTDQEGSFLSHDHHLAAPPLSTLPELEHAVHRIESDQGAMDDEYLKWLSMLISPGSSLGGARPKSSVSGDKGELWIAKFPSRYDDYDIGAFEMLCHNMAVQCGITMSDCYIKKFHSRHHTFLTKRFDRIGTTRRHFSSAMTQLNHIDGDGGGSYLELAEFLMMDGANTKADLEQLFRRMVFSIAVTNCDDHLRNHGFLLTPKGWTLSPAYDINPVAVAGGLSLNISENDNSLDFNLALEVGDYFRLKPAQASTVVDEVKKVVSCWRKSAKNLGINRGDCDALSSAFRF